MVGKQSFLLTLEMRTSSGKASNTHITLVKKRCAWHLRVKLKPHNELPHSEGEEFLEVDVNGPESRCVACGRRWRLRQQWSCSY